MCEMKTPGRALTAVQVLCPGHSKTQEIQAQGLPLLLLVITLLLLVITLLLLVITLLLLVITLLPAGPSMSQEPNGETNLVGVSIGLMDMLRGILSKCI